MEKTAKELVLSAHPTAQCAWTSKGWRVFYIADNGKVVDIGRTDSAHVPEDAAWQSAALHESVAQHDRVCSVCAGEGDPGTGLPCICGGSGKAVDEARNRAALEAQPEPERGTAPKIEFFGPSGDGCHINVDGKFYAYASNVHACWKNALLRALTAPSPLPVREQTKRDIWFKEFRPIINAIGEISVQEAMDAIERDL